MRGSLWSGFLALAMCFSMAWVDLRLERRASDAPAPPETAAPAQRPALAAASESLRVLHGDELFTLDMEEYLIGVVAAEMPADFEPEALKAQAVAARTYARYCAETKRHPEADVCTDFACCQAWRSDEELRASWGEGYEARHEKVAEAVRETAGELLCYDGRAIFAAFHSSSAGRTEDCGAIWSELPYLVSVSSPESADSVPGFVSRVDIGVFDLRDTLLAACPDADFSAPPEEWIGEITRDESGRVSEAVIGGRVFTGVKLREIFKLRSTAFTVDYADGIFTFTVTGFGHGVGMSQYGANVMAMDGADYREILAHYYPGTELVSLW